MKKIINCSAALVDETLAGYALANSDQIALVPGTHFMVRRQKKAKSKVRFAIGNGAGHEPAVIGWVGPGLFDINIVGEIFTAPSGMAIADGVEMVSEGDPVLLAVQNHAGDVLNANAALEELARRGVPVKSVLFYDDIASAPREFVEERRGIGGMLFYAKIVGALCERGAGIDECVAMFEKVRDATRTYGVAITNCTHPVTGQPMFSIADDEIELGMGVHGEGGMNTMKLPSAKTLADHLLCVIDEDMPLKPGSRVLVMLNGAGGMTMMELSILYGEVHGWLTARGVDVAGCKVGNFLTTQELSGVTLSLCQVDEAMISLWHDPSDAPLFQRV